VAVVLTLIQTKQIRINIYKRNNTGNTVQTTQNTVNYQNSHINTKHPAKLHIFSWKTGLHGVTNEKMEVL